MKLYLDIFPILSIYSLVVVTVFFYNIRRFGWAFLYFLS